MKTSRCLAAVALFVLGLVAPSSATMYHGTITQTVTASENPDILVGQIFKGCYTYESDTIDGVFGSSAFWDYNPDCLPTLGGFVGSLCGDTLATETDPYFLNQGAMRLLSHIEVVDGQVVDFFKMVRNHGDDSSFGFTTFSVTNNSNQAPGSFFHLFGTMAFSAPSAVPDSAPTAILLIASLLTCAAVRTRRR